MEDNQPVINWGQLGAFTGVAFIFLFVAAISFVLGKKSSNNEIIKVAPTPATLGVNAYITPLSQTTVTPVPTKVITVVPTKTLKTLRINSLKDTDGFRSSNGGGNNKTDIRAGMNSTLVTRGFASFELTDIPEGAIIENAGIRLYQAKVDGTPYLTGGSLKVDHFNYGERLEESDYQAPSLLANITTLSEDSLVGWKRADVTSAIKASIEKKDPKIGFRIHFLNENLSSTDIGDFVYFESSEDYLKTGNVPELIINYY